MKTVKKVKQEIFLKQKWENENKKSFDDLRMLNLQEIFTTVALS